MRVGSVDLSRQCLHVSRQMLFCKYFVLSAGGTND
jgi:hypothetical protein